MNSHLFPYTTLFRSLPCKKNILWLWIRARPVPEQSFSIPTEPLRELHKKSLNRSTRIQDGWNMMERRSGQPRQEQRQRCLRPPDFQALGSLPAEFQLRER